MALVAVGQEERLGEYQAHDQKDHEKHGQSQHLI
jgi:hypothetical protein